MPAAVFAVFLLVTLMFSPIHAQTSETWPPPNPERDYPSVWTSEISEDKVVIGSRYNHGSYPKGQLEIQHVANWACGLYQRTAVFYNRWANDARCDEMGIVAAERSSDCWRNHHFACAIPPK